MDAANKNHIYYRQGYKYQLAYGYQLQLPRKPVVLELYGKLEVPFIQFLSSGLLVIKAGYAWDGPSGPTIDTRSSMRASLVHDALYQLMRHELLDEGWRKTADDIFYNICIEDGMWKWRAELWHRELRKFAKSASLPESRKVINSAP